MKILWILLWAAPWTIFAGIQRSPAPGQVPVENIARGKAYVLEPMPSYPHCTDPGDGIQLTDGERTQGYFWTQKSTVGWSGVVPVIITLDLGAVEPISGVSYGTAAGVAGVSFPSSIFILASEDGKAYFLAGDLVELSGRKAKPPAEGYGTHIFRADSLKARGRFVKLIISGGQYTFVDEIEVFQGPKELLEGPPSGKRVDDPRAFFAGMRITASLKARLRADLSAVEGALKASSTDEDSRRRLQVELSSLEAEIAGVEAGPPEEFTTVFPVNDLHRRIFAVQGAIWRAAGHRGIVVWQKCRWDMLSPMEPPLPGGARIDVAMMRGEFRGAAFNLSNAGEAAARIRFVIEGLPGGRTPDSIAVHEVPFTDTRSGIPVAAALPLARKDGDAYLLEIPSGMTRQVWLAFCSKGLPAGDHRGEIRIDGLREPIEVRLKVHALDFPDRPALHLGGWDYTDRDSCYEVTPENREAFLRHLREHFVDTPWAQSAVMPAGKYDREGGMTEPPATQEFRKWLGRWPGASNYYVFAAVGESFAGFPMGSPAFRKALSGWIDFWVGKLKEWGLRPGQLGLLLVDEPSMEAQDRIIIEYARVIRAAQPEVVIWEDPIWQDPSKATPELFQVCGVLCPNLPMWIDGGKPFAEVYLRQKRAGRRLWFYSCSGPGKLLDPYSYHRLQAWFCFLHGAEGMGYWAFGDSNGASSWNEYAATIGAYTPLFLDKKTVTAGKHMEAVREGVEDFEYLRMLRDRIGELEGKGTKGEALERAKALLAGAPERVTACMTSSKLGHWREPKDRDLADRARIEILEALSDLAGR